MAPQARYAGDFVAWSGGALFIGTGASPVAPHAHYAIQVVAGAPSGLRVQDGRRGEWTSCAAAIVPSRTVHSIDVTGCDWTCVLFVEPETTVGRALSARLHDRRVEPLEASVVAGPLAALGDAWREQRSPDAVRDVAQDLVARLTGLRPHTASDPRVLRAIEHLREHADAPPSLEQLAALVQLSPSRLRHLFVEETGMPLRSYQLWRRLLRVWEFQMQGDSLSQAAAAAGFADAAHLSRTCRTMFGLPPSALQMTGPLSHARRSPAGNR